MDAPLPPGRVPAIDIRASEAELRKINAEIAERQEVVESMRSEPFEMLHEDEPAGIGAGLQSQGNFGTDPPS